MLMTYPIPVQLLDKKLNEYLAMYNRIEQFDLYLNESERMSVYTTYSLAFAKIANINNYYYSLIKLIDDCIRKGEVIAIIPLKGFTKMELLYVGKPPIFIIIYPFVEEKSSITQLELYSLSLELIYQIFFVIHVMEHNSLAFSQNKEYEELSDPVIELKFQKLRLSSFKSFWSNYKNQFNNIELPEHLDALYN